MNDLKLGVIITDDQQRDAIHIAVAPVVAAERLYAGQHVGLDDNGKAAPANPIGIVDPFLTVAVFPDQRFWLFLYPNTITTLRHDWTHPAFGVIGRSVISESEKWLREYADDIGLSYSALIDATKQYVNNGDYYVFGHDTPDRVFTDVEDFWKHYEVVTGEKVDDHQATFFSCAC